ncbi:hypothetical protein OJ252_1482 [Cryptosporidium canis]|uniref:Uncharacterized protein n=1 Tax=Cryptosporidium canis TaxID=195482 RepID=A0ABQ8P7X8_9CRYT|nr:hypothetical protein OJ252_1482 [Cryptosporidium canis]
MLISLRHLAFTCVVAFLIGFLNNSFNHAEFGIITEHSYLKVGKPGGPRRPSCFSGIRRRLRGLFRRGRGGDGEDGYQSHANRSPSRDGEQGDLDTFNNDGVNNPGFQEGDDISGGNTELPEQVENEPETPEDLPHRPVPLPRTKFNVLNAGDGWRPVPKPRARISNAGDGVGERPVPAPRKSKCDCDCGQKETDPEECDEFDDPDDKAAAFV